MSNMSEYSGKQSFAEQKAAEILEKQAHALAEAVAAVDPENSAKSALEIFPEPGERRADTEFSLLPEQEKAFREAMAKLGIGRETNQTAAEVGLTDGYIAVIEGGQAHKMAAELQSILLDSIVVPGTIIVAATPERKIPVPESDKAKERETTAKVLGIDINEVGDTEYDVAKQVVESVSYYRPIADPDVYNVSYDMEGNTTQGTSGQFTLIGYSGMFPIVMLRVDRKYSGDGKYKTLGTKGILRAVDGFARRDVGENSDIGFVTSATYQPSREIDAASAMIEIEREGGVRNIGVITYGTHQLAEVKKENYPMPPALGQLAGEAHKATKQLEILRKLIS